MLKIAVHVGLVVVAGWVLAGDWTGGRAAGEERAGTGKPQGERKLSIKEQLSDFERTMDTYFRRDPQKEAQASANRMAQEFNVWAAQQQAALKAEETRLDAKAKEDARLAAQIRDLDGRLSRKPDPRNQEAVDAYNALVESRNALVEKHNGLARACQDGSEALQKAVRRFEDQAAVSRLSVQAAQKKADVELDAYRSWLGAKKDLEFWSDLNRFYVRLLKERGRVGLVQQLEQQIGRVRAMRRELGDLAISRQKEAGNGLIVVRARLGGQEEATLIVDTGASLVTLSPAMVELLGWSSRVGEDRDVFIAGGIRVKARELVIPRLTVLGMEAQDVQGIVMDEPQAGVDGLLGMSFLSRFDYRIDPARDPKLILKAR